MNGWLIKELRRKNTRCQRKHGGMARSRNTALDQKQRTSEREGFVRSIIEHNRSLFRTKIFLVWRPLEIFIPSTESVLEFFNRLLLSLPRFDSTRPPRGDDKFEFVSDKILDRNNRKKEGLNDF